MCTRVMPPVLHINGRTCVCMFASTVWRLQVWEVDPGLALRDDARARGLKLQRRQDETRGHRERAFTSPLVPAAGLHSAPPPWRRSSKDSSSSPSPRCSSSWSATSTCARRTATPATSGGPTEGCSSASRRGPRTRRRTRTCPPRSRPDLTSRSGTWTGTWTSTSAGTTWWCSSTSRRPAAPRSAATWWRTSSWSSRATARPARGSAPATGPAEPSRGSSPGSPRAGAAGCTPTGPSSRAACPWWWTRGTRRVPRRTEGEGGGGDLQDRCGRRVGGHQFIIELMCSTHSLDHMERITRSLTHSHSLIHSLTYSHLFTPSLIPFTSSLIHSLTHPSLPHLFRSTEQYSLKKSK